MPLEVSVDLDAAAAGRSHLHAHETARHTAATMRSLRQAPLLRQITEDELDAVQALIERCDEYYVLTTGAGPKPTAARGVWDALPPDLPRGAKLTLGVYLPGLVGLVDVVRGWPRAKTWLIGLLLLAPDVRGRGVGAHAVSAIDAAAAEAGATSLRVAVVHANAPALAFWQRLGFVEVPSMQPDTIALEREVAARTDPTAGREPSAAA